ncbi:flagellar hook-associated protein FlgL [Tahibacter soli]|uniref:Flagellar hook-associated protein FlgL n=1 Tax=Tahibacter soli TaxID=2983605 RepID=A0A9X4BJ41_9GAMM|nr:flagellar hook-associated protein FlgL [Tahibacter soli]MDC8012852.1 flagellar hook-associated protein FlgL [Tahibacter soli]
MNLRIATSTLYDQGVAAMLRRQAEIARTQSELTGGSRIGRAGDDPLAAGLAVSLDRAQARLAQFGENAQALEQRLGMAENALSGFTSRLTQVRELALRASNDTLSPADRQVIAGQLRDQYDALVALANSGDGTGRYLFGGGQDADPPFVRGVAVTYAGDDLRRSVDVGPDTALADVPPGSDVFQRIPTGNGTFAVRAAAGNTGSATLASTGTSSTGSWDGGSYRLRFDGAGGYAVLDGAGATVASGSYTPGAAMAFKGVQVTINGQPGTGDEFSVRAAPPQDAFATVKSLADAIDASGGAVLSAAGRNAVFAGLEDLEQAQQHVTSARASIGGRLAALDAAADERSANALALSGTLSQLRETDYAEAASRLSQQLVGLQAAQQTFVKVQNASLFDFLR